MQACVFVLHAYAWCMGNQSSTILHTFRLDIFSSIVLWKRLSNTNQFQFLLRFFFSLIITNKCKSIVLQPILFVNWINTWTLHNAYIATYVVNNRIKCIYLFVIDNGLQYDCLLNGDIYMCVCVCVFVCVYCTLRNEFETLRISQY